VENVVDNGIIKVIRYLIKKGWTTVDQLAIRGGSAGGLLMGAVMNMAPELVRTVVAEVPFVDVLNTMLDPNLPLSITEREEWGNPEDPNVYHRLKRYSPYDNIRKLRYPSIYITGGLHDCRVGYWEPMKWALALRDAHHSNRVYLNIEGTGHGGSTDKHHQWKDEAEILSFILSEILKNIKLSRKTKKSKKNIKRKSKRI
jgi:oligopeptidase B